MDNLGSLAADSDLAAGSTASVAIVTEVVRIVRPALPFGVTPFDPPPPQRSRGATSHLATSCVICFFCGNAMRRDALISKIRRAGSAERRRGKNATSG